MTAQIFVDLMNHGRMTLNRVNLLIFDECHAAVESHPMKQIMQKFIDYPIDEQPRVLAMSATLLNSNISNYQLENTLKVCRIK